VVYEDHVETSSVVRVASTLANGMNLDDSISYTPKRAWLPEPTTVSLTDNVHVLASMTGNSQ